MKRKIEIVKKKSEPMKMEFSVADTYWMRFIENGYGLHSDEGHYLYEIFDSFGDVYNMAFAFEIYHYDRKRHDELIASMTYPNWDTVDWFEEWQEVAINQMCKDIKRTQKKEKKKLKHLKKLKTIE